MARRTRSPIRLAAVSSILLACSPWLGSSQGAATQPEARAAEKVSLAPKLALGDRLLYRIETLTTFPIPAGEGEAAPGIESYRLDALLRLTVAGIDDASGLRAVTGVFVEVGLTAEVEGRTASVRSREGDEAEPGTDEDTMRAHPVDLALADVAEALRARVLLMDVGPDGRVTSLAGLEPAFDAAAAHSRVGERALGPFRAGMGAETFAAIFGVDRAPDAKLTERAPGESWSVTTRSSIIGESARVRRTANLTLDRIDDRSRVHVDGKERIRIERPSTTGGPDKGANEIELSATVDDTEIRVVWDAQAGRLERRADRFCFTLEAGVGDLVRVMPGLCTERTITHVRKETQD